MAVTALRTHTCGELTGKDIKKEIKLCGWTDSRRDHGGIIFIDLRDRYGLTQVRLDPKKIPEAEKIRREWCLQVHGKVIERPKGMANPKIKTGEIEIDALSMNILSESETPPFEIDDRVETNEELRLKYRYLDLRRNIMQKRIETRHKASQAAREYLSSEKFLEIETPMLVKTTPGGARVYKVPSRVHPGKFYALPESPQMYKQLLMVSGFDRYFQIARCLRDEDLRIDRQPEFTQIDIEMSFVEPEDVFEVVEGMLKSIFKKAADIEIKVPFQRLTYEEAMTKYGSDKPDLRFSLEFEDVTAIAKHSDFSVFKSEIDRGGVVYCLNAKKCSKFSRTEIEELIEIAKTHHLSGLAWIKVSGKKLESSIVKYLPEKVQEELMKKVKAEDGDLLLFAAENFKKALTALGEVRLHIGRKLGLMKENEHKFCWVTKFPAFEFNEETNSLQAMHHIFTAPLDEDLKLIEKDPGKVRAKAYDVVLNGVEIGGGSIRIHKRDIQKRMLQVTGLTYEDAEKKFDFLLNAFKFGAPNHGGIALGMDRLCALLCGINDIREVIAFPKTKAAENPMDCSPQDWTPEFLKELNLKLDVIKK